MSSLMVSRITCQARCCALALAIGALYTFKPAAAEAQDMDIPVQMQVALFLKVITFDRNLVVPPASEIVVAVVFQSGYRTSVNAKNIAMTALQMTGNQRKIRAIAIDLDREPLAAALTRHMPSVLYVAPLRAVEIGDLAVTARNAGVTTVTGVPQYIALGLAVSVRLQGERPKLVINAEAAKLEGADFSTELLKLAQIWPE
ncbi:MAG TPA: YfiR family protein [Gemmatimonadaceae bacterium]|nr:YfiR family protein [Gemmatimonadaceae bacterium]